MPILSTERHRRPYKQREDAEQRLRDVESLLRTITTMPLHLQTKRMMLNRVLWLVVELTGNFYCQYRSAGVLRNMGVRIQRDHVFPRKHLVEELLGHEPDFSSIVKQAQCCVVTHEEHQLLTQVPQDIVGWDRYKQAGVQYHDMLTHVFAEI